MKEDNGKSISELMVITANNPLVNDPVKMLNIGASYIEELQLIINKLNNRIDSLNSLIDANNELTVTLMKSHR